MVQIGRHPTRSKFRCTASALIVVVFLIVFCLERHLLNFHQSSNVSTESLEKLLELRPKIQQCPVGILNSETHTLDINKSCPASAKLLRFPSPPTNKRVTFLLLYYNDHHLLAQQLDSWTKFSQEALDQIQFLVVDDGSVPGHGAKDFFRANLELTNKLDLALYRIDQDMEWNIGGARNLGFWMASTPWVFMSDGDIRVEPDTMDYILTLANDATSTFIKNNVSVSRLYGYFQRYVAPNEKKPHPAVMLAKKKDYWIAGGCDEDFVGHYGQTDPHFRYRVYEHPALHMEWAKVEMDEKNITPLIYLDKHVQCPAGVTCLEKYAGKKLTKDTAFNKKLMEGKKRTGRWTKEYLRFTWKRVTWQDR